MNKFFKIALTFLLLISLSGCKNNQEIKMHIISDIHYAPRSLYEYTGKFAKDNDTNGTGKQIKYQEEIIDAYIKQEIEEKPDYILITGDLVFSGSKEAHEVFADKFKTLIDNGIKVLVLPGNHDFDHIPFTYSDDTYHYGFQISADDFKNIYNDFGYSEARSIDQDSLSYGYKLDDKTYLIALDTLMVYGATIGEIKDSTLTWLKEELEYAKNNRMNVIMAGHHNIYVHNNMFDYGYRINNAEDVISLMKEYDVHLYLSGHMHIQDIGVHNTINEILTESFTLFPHRYGELIINNHNYSYSTIDTDIEKNIDTTNNDLSNYNTYGYNFIFNNFYAQLLRNNEDFLSKEDEANELLEKLAELNVKYFLGEKADEELLNEINNSKHKELVSKYIQSIIQYMNKDNFHLDGSLN